MKLEALEILKELQEITFKSKECFGYEANFRFNQAYIYRLNEAIKELEALENRSCESCKFATSYFGTDRKWCEESIKQDGMTTVDKDFYCKRWQTK